MVTELEGSAPWTRKRRLGHYGAAPDKRNTTAEATPYAYGWYRELQAMRGSAFSSEMSGLYHAENLAVARVYAGLSRAADKLRNNSTPHTSAERLGYWLQLLGVGVYPDDTLHDIRRRCAAHYQAANGPTEPNVDQAVEALLGDRWVRNWRQRGSDLANPPTQTFWPNINNGPNNYSLGGGTWLSERAHLVVEVQQLDNETTAEFLRAMNVDLFGLLDNMLDSHATFNWALDVQTGFVLDVSQLDFTGFNP